MSIIQEIPQKIHAKLNKGGNWLDVIFLSLVMAFIFAGITLTPFHGDESTYILLSEDYDKIVKQHDFNRVLFSFEGNSKQYLRLSTGSILAYSIGFARDITNNDDQINKWLWGSSWEENILQGNMPNPRILNLARVCSALMGAFGIGLIFFTARQLFSSRFSAWAATLILVTHGGILVNIRRAMQEGPKFLFLILTIYIASHILKNLKDSKMPRYGYVFLGISSGLTLAAKQDIVPMLVAVYVALALIPIWKKGSIQTILINLFYLGLATGLAFAFFLAFMPVFWGWWESVLVVIGLVTVLFQLPVWKVEWTTRPLALAGCALVLGMTIVSPTLWGKFFIPVTSMVETRESIIEGNHDHDTEKSLLNINTAKNRLAFLLETTVTSKVMYMEVSSFDIPPFHQQISTYEASILSGRTGSPLVDGFIVLLTIIGGWVLLKQFNGESLFIYSLLIITAVLLFIMIPTPWQRYFLIMQIPYSLIAGVGANQVWIWGKSLIQSNQKEKQSI
jgi:hypothetical protein